MKEKVIRWIIFILEILSVMFFFVFMWLIIIHKIGILKYRSFLEKELLVISIFSIITILRKILEYVEFLIRQKKHDDYDNYDDHYDDH